MDLLLSLPRPEFVVDKDPPELLAGADDEDGHLPGTRGRGVSCLYLSLLILTPTAAPRKVKEDALNSRSNIITTIIKLITGDKPQFSWSEH